LQIRWHKNIATKLISSEMIITEKDDLSTTMPPLPKINQFDLREEFT
jgi:hypothetical protein